VRVPANGVEMNQAYAKQALDRGVYGVIWPHINDVAQAYNAVSSCRYGRPKNAPLYEPRGVRGDGPATAARYWGLSQAEYYAKADVWPLAPQGEILVGLMIESVKGVENLDEILKEVPGVGFVLIGEGDLSQEMGFPRQYDHPGRPRRHEEGGRDLRAPRRAGRQSAHQRRQSRAPAGRGLPLPDGRSATLVRRGRQGQGNGRLLTVPGSREGPEIYRFPARLDCSSRLDHGLTFLGEPAEAAVAKVEELR
jgi:hypothetical protein